MVTVINDIREIKESQHAVSLAHKHLVVSFFDKNVTLRYKWYRYQIHGNAFKAEYDMCHMTAELLRMTLCHGMTCKEKQCSGRARSHLPLS